MCKTNELYPELQKQLYDIAAKIAEDIVLQYKLDNKTSVGVIQDLEQKIRVIRDLNHAITLIDNIY